MTYGLIPPDEEFSEKQKLRNNRLQKTLQELKTPDEDDYTPWKGEHK